jgi:uncharacterized membrane protein YfcA
VRSADVAGEGFDERVASPVTSQISPSVVTLGMGALAPLVSWPSRSEVRHVAGRPTHLFYMPASVKKQARHGQISRRLALYSPRHQGISHVPHSPDIDVLQPTTARAGAIAVVSGFVTGAAAGLIGVGGGEFRIPVLVQLLGFPLKLAGGVNLVIGLFTVLLGVLRRWGRHSWTRDDLMLIAIMSGVSIVGAALGSMGRGKLPFRPLKWIVCGYLTIVGVWMLYEAIAHVEHVLLEPTGIARWVLATVVAFLIAVASGVLGVAGGEMRIPALLYLFAVPIEEAGTLSLVVSIPTVAAGAFTDRRLGRIPNPVLMLAVAMGAASAAGVLVGAALLQYANRDVIKGALGVILLLATVRLTVVPEHAPREF